ncbi:putative pentatricopeptide repeat-containing protein At5g43820 [Telopea speciosissima]|uniref:putative pentatricopeptide repeat-containing protein At5g43820 n=1 Tax=Telopea speciosissima TaxID=54955 RepID=UPI001CC658A3|nr:putative pentatricopeptide repeat-containing protein At5g43820 [Telopea speciosissima]
MASKRRGFVGLLAQFNRTRYPQFPSNSSISFSLFSTLDLTKTSSICEPSYDQINHASNMDELSVLKELSNLLPIHPKTSTYRPFTESSSEKQIQCREVDGYLAPAEKLRGVFLQKLSGKSAIESSLTGTSVDLTLDIVAEVVNRGNLGGEAMVTFFNWAVKHPSVPNDLQTYHIILKALGRRKFFKFMEEILNEMNKHGIHPNSETLSIAMDSYVRARKVSKAVQMFQRLEEFGSKSDTESLNVLLRRLCQRSHVGTANSLFLALSGKMPFNRTTYNIIISGWSKIGKVSEIERSLKSMMEDELDPDCLTFSYILESLGRAGRIDDAVGVFDQMQQKGCPPDTVAYNVMISNFLSVGDLDSSVKYYEKMLEMNCAPDLDTYTKLISAFLKSRRVADALEMFDDMLCRGIFPNTGAVTSIIEPLCNFGPPHAAMVIYKKARKVGCRISLKAYKLLLMRLSRFGKCGMVLKVWDEMQESGYSSDTDVYEYVINGLCNIGQLENAALVMEESLCKGFCPSKFIYSKLNNKLMDANRVERAYKLFLKVKKARRAENSRRFWRANGWHF